jgi:hypothetical protein
VDGAKVKNILIDAAGTVFYTAFLYALWVLLP